MVSKFQQIYDISPLWVQNILISLYGRKIYYQRYGRIYFEARKKFLESDYSNLLKEEDLQLERLKSFIKFAILKSPFYKDFYKGIDVNCIETINDLQLLPILEKDVFRQNVDKIYTLEAKDAISSFTGGTTGKSIKVLFTKDDFQKRMAYLDAFKIRVGIDPFKSKKATFSGRQFTKLGDTNNFWRYNSTYNQKLYSTFDLSEKNMPLYIKDLNNFKPEVINGFVSALFELAKFIEANEISLTFVPKAIFTTSETLLSYHRELIERIFKTKIYNQYASAEGAPFITECQEGSLHYNLDTGVIEVLETEYGSEMLVTSFFTHGTPLIRYRIGDKIEFDDKQSCACGSCHPIIRHIEGRQVEFLFSKEKGKVSLSHLADVIKGLPNNILKMQFIQEIEEQIIVKMVVDKDSFQQKDENSITNEMKYRFGKKMDIVFDFVQDIPREKSGKYALIKNNLIS